jgi:hypothetical protein
MRWNPFKRLGPPEPKIVVGNIESFHVAPVDSDDPKAVEDAHRMEVEVGRRLEGAHDAKEIRQRIERYEREHGMKEIASSEQRWTIVPDAKTIEREGQEGLRRIFEELERELAGVDDPEELRLRTESFARERGWTIQED